MVLLAIFALPSAGSRHGYEWVPEERLSTTPTDDRFICSLVYFGNHRCINRSTYVRSNEEVLRGVTPRPRWSKQFICALEAYILSTLFSSEIKKDADNRECWDVKDTDFENNIEHWTNRALKRENRNR